MPVRVYATLLLVATAAACSDPFEAGPASGDAQTNASEPDATADAPTTSDDADVGLTERIERDAKLEPPVVQDLMLWLRADMGVTEMQGTVSSWADQSGHHSDAVQTDPMKQPKLSSSGPSGRSAVVFDTDDFMSLPAGFGDFSLGISMFAVFSAEPTAMCADALDFSNGTEVDDITLGRHQGHVHYEVAADGMSGDDFPLNTPTLASVVQSPDMTVQLRVNSAPFTVANFTPPAVVTRLSNVIGRSLYADCGSLNGGIWEALVYNRALDNDERALVESYLQTRWGCCK